MPDTLLFIDNDAIYCKALEGILTENGFQVVIAHDATAGLKMAQVLQPDVVILEVMLPDLDGWQTCFRLRAMSDVPIIFYTTLRAEENVVKGLNLGADGYIFKPVTPAVLVARIRAVLQRSKRAKAAESNSYDNIFTHGHLVVDYDHYRVMVDGQEVDLSLTEFQLLAVLTRYKGHLLTHRFLLREVWGSEQRGTVKKLHLYISCLQRKLKQKHAKPDLIGNEWGIGYRFG